MHTTLSRSLARAARRSALGGCALLLAACAGPTPQLDRNFGNRAAQLVAQQLMYPDAKRNPDQVKGMDGQAASAAYDQYQKSFSAPEQQANPFTIGVSGK